MGFVRCNFRNFRNLPKRERLLWRQNGSKGQPSVVKIDQTDRLRLAQSSGGFTEQAEYARAG